MTVISSIWLMSRLCNPSARRVHTASLPLTRKTRDLYWSKGLSSNILALKYFSPKPAFETNFNDFCGISSEYCPMIPMVIPWLNSVPAPSCSNISAKACLRTLPCRRYTGVGLRKGMPLYAVRSIGLPSSYKPAANIPVEVFHNSSGSIVRATTGKV